MRDMSSKLVHSGCSVRGWCACIACDACNDATCVVIVAFELARRRSPLPLGLPAERPTASQEPADHPGVTQAAAACRLALRFGRAPRARNRPAALWSSEHDHGAPLNARLGWRARPSAPAEQLAAVGRRKMVGCKRQPAADRHLDPQARLNPTGLMHHHARRSSSAASRARCCRSSPLAPPRGCRPWLWSMAAQQRLMAQQAANSSLASSLEQQQQPGRVARAMQPSCRCISSRTRLSSGSSSSKRWSRAFAGRCRRHWLAASRITCCCAHQAGPPTSSSRSSSWRATPQGRAAAMTVPGKCCGQRAALPALRGRLDQRHPRSSDRASRRRTRWRRRRRAGRAGCGTAGRPAHALAGGCACCACWTRPAPAGA